MQHAKSAELWAKLERFLIERCGLPNGRMLEVNRPYLIRWVGGRLTATDVGRALGNRKSRATDMAGEEAIQQGRIAHGTAVAVTDVSPPRDRTVVRVREHWTDAKHWDDTVVDSKLAAMLERSCSRRVGYDGDDEVDYASHDRR